MQNMIENLINGNLRDAKKQARRFSETKIYSFLKEIGWSERKAQLATAYLKTGLGFQEYCDAK